MASTGVTFYGFSNVDISKQIIAAKGVLAGISRAGQTISIYHGETLIADCTMPSTGIEGIPTVVLGDLTVHDETFTGFVDGETYTIVAGDEPPITGFVMNGGLLSFDPSALWYILPYRDMVIAQDSSASRTNYTISQKITTTKKRYDIKRLPEELLPKTVATKAEVRKAQTSADAAHAKLNDTWDFADSAWEKAAAAQSAAETATFWSSGDIAYAPNELTVKAQRNTTYQTFDGHHLIIGEKYTSTIAPNSPAVWNGEQMMFGVGQMSVTIAWVAKTMSYRISSPSTMLVTFSGKFLPVPSLTNGAFMTLPPYVVVKNLVLNSSTPNSTKQFKITVDDSGVISATEVE